MPDYIKVYVAAGVVVKQDGKYLLVQEKKPSAYGLWNLPAGRVEEGSTIEGTAVREAKEETGYDVEIISHLDIFQGSDDGTSTCAHAFEAKIVGGELKVPEDMLDVKWFTYEEILKMKEKFRGLWQLKAIDLVEKGK